MEDSNNKWEEVAFSRFRDGESVKTDRYRYTEWTDDDGEMYARMLYDHQLDPNENTNIAELPGSRQIVKDLSKMLKNNIQ